MEDYSRIIEVDESKGSGLNLRHVIFPSILAGFSITAIAYFWDITQYGIIFASFGSSAFIVYVYPKSEQAQLRR